MNVINKIIINELTSRRSVYINRFGSFVIISLPSEVNADGSVLGPYFNVGFAEGRAEGSVSINDVLRELDMNDEKIDSLVYSWIESGKIEGGYKFPGIGSLAGSTFVADESLLEKINNGKREMIKGVSPKKSNGSSIAVIILSILLLAAVGYYWFALRPASQGNIPDRSAVSEIYTPVPEEVTPVPVVETEESGQPVVKGTAVNKKYHVVAGVFSVEANADKYISNYKKAYPEVEPVKLPYKNGLYLVSIYSTDDHRDAVNKEYRYKRNHFNSEIWLYEKK